MVTLLTDISELVDLSLFGIAQNYHKMILIKNYIKIIPSNHPSILEGPMHAHICNFIQLSISPSHTVECSNSV